jgi:plasmid stability protein
MVTLEINLSEDVVERLKARAEREQRTIEDLVVQGASVVATESQDVPHGTTLEKLLLVSDYAGIEIDANDDSEHTRDILRREYTKHLENKLGLIDNTSNG